MASPELLVADVELSTRERIRRFSLAFGRPVNEVLASPSVSDRLLLGKLLIEEAVETVTLGLGLTLSLLNDGEVVDTFIEGGAEYVVMDAGETGWPLIALTHLEGDKYDPGETADGLGDVNVVIHFMAHWLGMNLDRITAHIDDSNMSKLGEDGKAIINRCVDEECRENDGIDDLPCEIESHLIDPSKPAGKILKGPNFWDAKPGIPAILAEGNRP